MTTKTITAQRHSASALRLNVADTAHFITHYDANLLRQLVNDISTDTISPVDRVQLLDESTLLARAGTLQSVQLIDLTKAYRDETNEQVWTIIAMALAELRKFVEDDEQAEQKLRAFSAAIAQTQYRRLGWTARPNESEDDTKLRATVISLVLYGEDQEAIDAAKAIYNKTSLEELDAELRPLIISAVVRYGDEAIVDELLARYVSSQSGELRQDICVGITSTRLPHKITGLLDSIKNTEVVRPQDAARWFVYLIRGRESRDQSWQWIRDNWQWVVDTFAGDKSYDDYPRYSAGALTTRTQLREYTDFFMPMKNIPALTRVITMGVSEIEGRVELIERDGPAVRAALLNL